MSVFGISIKTTLYFLLIYAVCSIETAMAWQLQDMSGTIHQLSQYKGRWLIVNYWAPWCPPCLEEMPELVTFYDQTDRSKVMVLGVAVQYETEKSVKDYINDMLISYPIILGEIQKKHIEKIEVLPTTYIYRPDGSLYKVMRGKVTRQWLEHVVTDATQPH